MKEIQRLHQRGKPLNITAVKRKHPKLIKAAGLDYETIRLWPPPRGGKEAQTMKKQRKTKDAKKSTGVVGGTRTRHV